MTCDTRTRRSNSGIEPKILSGRVGHSNPTVTFQIYVHRSTGQDRAAAQLIGRLIEEAISGSEGTAPRGMLTELLLPF